MSFSIFLFGLLVSLVMITLTAVYKSMVIVRTGEVVLLERMGRYLRTLIAGPHFLIPLVDVCRRYRWSHNVEDRRTGAVHRAVTESYRMSTRITTYDFPPIEVVTIDQIVVGVNGVLWFQVTDPVKAMYNIMDMFDAMEQIVLTRLRERASTMTLVKLMQNKGLLQANVLADLKEPAAEWGMRITQLDIQSIDPPLSVVQATQASTTARLAAVARISAQEAECRVAVMHEQSQRDIDKITADSINARKIELAQVNATVTVTAAKAQREERFLRAEAAVRETNLQAEAKAKATASMMKALGGGIGARDGFIDLARAKVLEKLAGAATGHIQFIPAETLGIAGALSMWTAVQQQQQQRQSGAPLPIAS